MDSLNSASHEPISSRVVRVSRRRLLRVGLFTLAAVPLAVACSPSPPATKPAESKPAAAATTAPAAPAKPAEAAKPTEAAKPAAAAEPAKPTSFKQSPLTEADEKAGKIPPLAQRLPENPLVVQPIEEVGQYGGTWRAAFKGVADFHAYQRNVYESMLRWPRDPKGQIGPGLAEKWEFAPDGKQLTLTLRKGLKWSDGQPFTTDDILFWWEDIALDTNLSPSPPAEWVVNGKPMTLEKVSSEVIRLKWDGPNGMALRMLAFHGNQWPLNFERFGFYAPKHYLTQFHPKHNKSVTDYKLFNEKADDYNTERPAMTSWRITSWKAGDRFLVATRNPYYWKVDPAGNQLPYIDELRIDLVENDEAINLKAIAGEIDFQFRGIQISKFTLLQENKAKNGYRVLQWPDASGSKIAFFVNQTIADQDLRPVFQNPKFRQGLSYAINRKRVNEVAYFGLGKERNAILIPGSPFYEDAQESLYAQYDQAKSNALLDEVGLKKGADGFRTLPNGKPLELTIETYQTGGPEFDSMELIRKDWEAVGLKMALKTTPRETYVPRGNNGELQIGTWGTDRGLEPFVVPVYVFPYDERSWMAPAWGLYYKSGGKQGEKPEGDVAKAHELFGQFRSTVDPQKQIEIGKQIVKLESDNLWVIGTIGAVPSIAVVKNNFRNVPENAVTDWIFMSPGNLDPAQFFFKK